MLNSIERTFSKLTEFVTSNTEQGLNLYMKTLGEIIRETPATIDNFEKEFTKRFFRRSRYRIDEDILNYITDDVVVEAYVFAYGNPKEAIQIFRSQNFWAFPTYNIHTLMNVPYEQLFGRDEFINGKMRQEIKRIVSEGKMSKFYVPTHNTVELMSDVPQTYKMTCRHISPVWDDTQDSSTPIGFLCTYTAENITTQETSH